MPQMLNGAAGSPETGSVCCFLMPSSRGHFEEDRSMAAKSVWWQISYHREQTNTQTLQQSNCVQGWARRYTHALARWMSSYIVAPIGKNSVVCVISEGPYASEEFICFFLFTDLGGSAGDWVASSLCFIGICSRQAVPNSLYFTLHHF